MALAAAAVRLLLSMVDWAMGVRNGHDRDDNERIVLQWPFGAFRPMVKRACSRWSRALVPPVCQDVDASSCVRCHAHLFGGFR
jgi:hypothetical protein